MAHMITEAKKLDDGCVQAEGPEVSSAAQSKNVETSEQEKLDDAVPS